MTQLLRYTNKAVNGRIGHCHSFGCQRPGVLRIRATQENGLRVSAILCFQDNAKVQRDLLFRTAYDFLLWLTAGGLCDD